MLNNCFTTPIWVEDLRGPVRSQIDTEIERSLGWARAEPTPWEELGSTTFSFDGCNDVIKFRMDTLAQTLERSVNEFCTAVGYGLPAPQLSDSWLNWYGQGDFMFEHIHPDRLISGCYYHRVPEGSGLLKFKNPNPLMQWKAWPADRCRDQDFRVEPREGRLVLFPSWLTHRVGPNLGTDTRVSLAFNWR